MHRFRTYRLLPRAAWALLVACVPFAGAIANTDAVVTSPAAGAPKFDLLELRVAGNTVMPQVDIERVVYPFLGPDKSIDDVEAARSALEGRYHELGYGTVFVDIPEQDVHDGLVRLNVTEGRLHAVRVTGARYFSGRDIRAGVPSARVGEVPHLPTVQAELATINTATADRTVTPVLKAGPLPGTVDVALNVKDKAPFHGSLELNDAYTADTTRLRAIASVGYDNMFGRLDSASIQYQTAPEEPSEVSVLALSYVARLPHTDARLAAFFVDSDSDVATVGTLGVLGKGQIYGIRYVDPLASSAAGSTTVTFGLDYKDFAESIRLDDESSLNTPVSYFNWSAALSGTVRSENLLLTHSLAANFGIRSVGNNSAEFANKRYRGRPNYFYVRGEATLARPLPLRTTALFTLAGQVAAEPVIANEQFAIGGSSGVRGYYEAEALGDNGVHASAQLGSPTWKWGDHLSLSGFAFADYGLVGTLQPLPGEDSSTDLASLGLGLKIAAFDHVAGEMAWAYPLLDGDRTVAGDSRIHFVLRSSW